MSLYAREVIRGLQLCGVNLAVIQPGYELYGFWRDEAAKQVYDHARPFIAERANEFMWTLVAMDYVGNTDTNGRKGLPSRN